MSYLLLEVSQRVLLLLMRLQQGLQPTLQPLNLVPPALTLLATACTFIEEFEQSPATHLRS